MSENGDRSKVDKALEEAELMEWGYRKLADFLSQNDLYLMAIASMRLSVEDLLLLFGQIETRYGHEGRKKIVNALEVIDEEYVVQNLTHELEQTLVGFFSHLNFDEGTQGEITTQALEKLKNRPKSNKRQSKH